MIDIYLIGFKYTHIQNSLPNSGETAVSCANSSRCGEIKCSVNYSKYRISQNKEYLIPF